MRIGKVHKAVSTKHGLPKRLCDGIEINKSNEEFASRDPEKVKCANCLRMMERRKRRA